MKRTLKGKENPIIVALDVPTWPEAESLVAQLSPVVDFFKIGMELFTAAGPAAVEAVKAAGSRVFLDLKYHDIPNTVRGAVAAAARLRVDMLTVHTSGGALMMRAAAEAAGSAPHQPILLGVTVLTSIDAQILHRELRIEEELNDQVAHLGEMAVANGINGLVASPLEIAHLRQVLGDEVIIVTPGIRPAWEKPKDQRRVATPQEAIALGADYLVVGRPITAAPDPREAAMRILAELGETNGGGRK